MDLHDIRLVSVEDRTRYQRVGFQVCLGSFRQQKLTLCVTMKQGWIFHSYRRLRCVSRTTSSSYQELEPFAACRKGKHKYRGFAHGVVKPPSRRPRPTACFR